MERRAYAIQMSIDVPDAEKRIAEKAKESFVELGGRLKLFSEYLDMIYDPFKGVETIDPQEIVEHRPLLREIRDKVKEKAKKIDRRADKCMILMREFSSDTNTEEMMDSFSAAVEDVQKQVDTFLGIFSNLDSPDFRNNLVASVEAVKKQLNQLKQLLKDRILDHIDTNILAKNWVSRVSEKYQGKVQEKVPLIVELFRERQKAVNEKESTESSE
jgi:hypothetical protein